MNDEIATNLAGERLATGHMPVPAQRPDKNRCGPASPAPARPASVGCSWGSAEEFGAEAAEGSILSRQRVHCDHCLAVKLAVGHACEDAWGVVERVGAIDGGCEVAATRRGLRHWCTGAVISCL